MFKCLWLLIARAVWRKGVGRGEGGRGGRGGGSGGGDGGGLWTDWRANGRQVEDGFRTSDESFRGSWNE